MSISLYVNNIVPITRENEWIEQQVKERERDTYREREKKTQEQE